MEKTPKPCVFAAVRSHEEFLQAIESSVNTVFMLSANIDEIDKQVSLAHEKGKNLFLHIDLAEGIGKDAYGIRYLKRKGIDGIISTKTNIIKLAKKEELVTVQRFFIIDSKSIDTTIETIMSSKADMIEIMPGIIYKVIKSLKGKLDLPIVAGGLIQTRDEVLSAISAGAYVVSTGNSSLWNL